MIKNEPEGWLDEFKEKLVTDREKYALTGIVCNFGAIALGLLLATIFNTMMDHCGAWLPCF